jgi:isoamylase
MIPELATRFAGSSDLYGGDRHRPTASVNLITVQDRFTLADLVTYNDRHNEANGEDNRDGTSDNRSWNCGVEGPTDDPAILALRARQSRALLTTLLLSFGIPLLKGGDELAPSVATTTRQDSALTWFDWAGADQELLAFTRRLMELRRSHPVFRRRRLLVGVDADELRWFTPAGTPMTPENWADPMARCISIYLDGDDAPDRDDDGRLLVDDDVFVLINGWWEPQEFNVGGLRCAPLVVPRAQHLRVDSRIRPDGRPHRRRTAVHHRPAQPDTGGGGEIDADDALTPTDVTGTSNRGPLGVAMGGREVTTIVAAVQLIQLVQLIHCRT